MEGLQVVELTVEEFAKVERVSERQVRTWIAKGALEIRRTTGGGVRILERRSEVRDRAIFFSRKPHESGGSLNQ